MNNKDVNNFRKKCVAMWEWISEQPNGTEKSKYFLHKGIDSPHEDDCYACLVDDIIGGEEADCGDCPIDWGNDSAECLSNGTLYKKWNSRPTSDNAILFLEYIKANWEVLSEE